MITDIKDNQVRGRPTEDPKTTGCFGERGMTV